MTLTPMLIFVHLTGFFAGRRCYSEHGTSTSRVRAPAKGCRTTMIICPVGDGRAGDAERVIKIGRVDVPVVGAGG